MDDETKDALEMLGAGYNTIVIEPPRTITARHNGRMIEIEEPAWVKFSTDFKQELRTLDEYSLKVFLYIGLSVNWKTGVAFPGIRKIADETGMDKGTVAKATANLEELGFLTIQKRDGNSNIYKPVRYIAIGTVRPERTPSPEPSDENEELSDESTEPSDGQEGILHNKNNKNNKNKEENNASLSPADLEEVNRKMDSILGMTQGQEGYWQGRELVRADLLVYADWYNKVTNQIMTKRVQKSWWKAFGGWKEEGLLIEHLQESYDSNIQWRKVINDPNVLTKDAVAIKAVSTIKRESTVTFDKHGIPESW